MSQAQPAPCRELQRLPESQTNLDLLWKAVEDARLRWMSARNYVNEINEDRASMPTVDGSYAHLRALREQRLAVENYHRALLEFNGALERGEEQPSGTPNNGHQPKPLTQREREVLMLIVSGKSSKQIAAELGMAFRTAVCHRYHVYQKLKIHTNVELTRAAMRMGLIGC